LLLSGAADLLGIQAQVVGVAEHLLERQPRLVQCPARMSASTYQNEHAGKTHARSSAPDYRYYAQVKDRCNGKRAALSEARKILRQACHILAELGDDA
jgi:hypothetical protein